MKKILTILFLLISTASFAQIGLVNYDTIQSKTIQADSALWIQYLENGGTDTLLTHINGKVAYVLPSEFLLTQFDSTGFRITESQISDFDHFTTADEIDPIVGAVSGIVKADGAGNISAATDGTDYNTQDLQEVLDTDNSATNQRIQLNDGGNSVYVGTDAGENDDASDNWNVGVGYAALTNNTIGAGNTANGAYALHFNTEGNYNSVYGYQALYSNTTGVRNTANGMYALYSNITGDRNTAIGMYALYDLDNLNLNNSAFGYNTGSGIVTGDNNTILGANVTGLAADLNNNIILATGDGTIQAQFDGTDWTMEGNVSIEGTMDLKEQADANADVAGYGQIWVKNTTPNELWFTDDAGTDIQLYSGSGLWTDDTDGIYYTDNVGIGTGSAGSIGLFIDASNDDGLHVWGGGTTYLGQAFSVADGDGNANLFDIYGDGSIRMHQYGDGDFTGTATKWLAVDADGNLIEEDAPSGAGTDNQNISGSGLAGTILTIGIEDGNGENVNLEYLELDELSATSITDGYVLKADGSDGAVWEEESAGGGTDDQTLSFSGGSLSIEDGNSVDLDARYFTETELGSTTSGSSGANNIGTDTDNFDFSNSTNVQDVLEDFDGEFINTSVQSNDASINVNEGVNMRYDVSSGTTSKITITWSNLVAGMTGNITINNTANSNDFELDFDNAGVSIAPNLSPHGTNNNDVTVTDSSFDIYSWYWDGDNMFINGTQGYE